MLPLGGSSSAVSRALTIAPVAAADNAAQIAYKRQAAPAVPHPPGEAEARTGPSAPPAARPTRASGISTATITSVSGRSSARSTRGRGPRRHPGGRKHGAGRAKAIRAYHGRRTLAIGRRQEIRHLQSRPVLPREGTRGGHAAGTRTGRWRHRGARRKSQRPPCASAAGGARSSRRSARRGADRGDARQGRDAGVPGACVRRAGADRRAVG